MSDDEIKKQINFNLFTIPSIVEKINNLGSINANNLDIEKIFREDATSTLILLKLSNLVQNKIRKTVKDIKTAIKIVGFEKAKNILLTRSLEKIFDDNEKIGVTYTRSKLWLNNKYVALSNEFIYQKLFMRYDGFPYVAGLIRNIGVLVQDQSFHEGFIKCVLESEKNKTSLVDEEKKYMLRTHEELGKLLVEDFNFSEILKYLISNHHNYNRDYTNLKDKKEVLNLAIVTNISEIICNSINGHYSDCSIDSMYNLPFLVDNLNHLNGKKLGFKGKNLFVFDDDHFDCLDNQIRNYLSLESIY